jgi:hypothetical protein
LFPKHIANLENNLMNMYNMDISIGPYKFRLEIVILIVVIAWIMFGHLLCSCSKMGLKEGLETMVGKDVVEKAEKVADEVKDAVKDKKEGFSGANSIGYDSQFANSNNAGYIMPPAKWSMPTLEYTPGTQADAGVKAIWDRKPQPIPVPEGQLDMLATTPFKPECCPNAYSGSTGCACMTVDQYNYLRQRGGNNVPYDIY